jgi:transaldolase
VRGKAAIANARVAYEAFLTFIASDRWQSVASNGANLQRPLWASTGVKDKAYDATRYVIELIAAHCVNTMPEGTLNAVRDHGVVRGDTITTNTPAAHLDLADLAKAGIDLGAIVKHLEDDGVAKFQKAWDELLANVEALI